MAETPDLGQSRRAEEGGDPALSGAQKVPADTSRPALGSPALCLPATAPRALLELSGEKRAPAAGPSLGHPPAPAHTHSAPCRGAALTRPPHGGLSGLRELTRMRTHVHILPPQPRTRVHAEVHTETRVLRLSLNSCQRQ